MCCYVTSNEGPGQERVSSILPEDQYFDSEVNFCRVYAEDVLQYLERILLRAGISYFVKEENASLLARLLCMHRSGFVVRINCRDMEKAMYLTEDLRGIEIIGRLPEEEWTPSRARLRREEERQQAERFVRRGYRADEWDEEEDYDYYYERTQRGRQGA